MNPATHLMVTWSTTTNTEFSRKDRLLVTISGIIPDIDGLGIAGWLFYLDKQKGIELWGRYHHILAHNLPFGLASALLLAWAAQKKRMVLAYCLLCFHLHLFCDLIGSRGPDNYQWPIPYLWPLSEAPQLVWAGQWQLNAWPNIAITLFFLTLTFYIAWKQGTSPLGCVSTRMDQGFVNTLRARFGPPD